MERFQGSIRMRHQCLKAVATEIRRQCWRPRRLFCGFSGRSIPYQNWCFQAIWVNKIRQIGSWNPNFRVFFMKKKLSCHHLVSRNTLQAWVFTEQLFSGIHECWRKKAVWKIHCQTKKDSMQCASVTTYIYIFLPVYISTGIFWGSVTVLCCIICLPTFFCFPVIKIFTQLFTALFHCWVWPPMRCKAATALILAAQLLEKLQNANKISFTPRILLMIQKSG